MEQLALPMKGPFERAISPFLEMGAYEALWARTGTSFKTLATLFAANKNSLPSDFVDRTTAATFAQETVERLKAAGVNDYGVRIHTGGEYPTRLRLAQYPPELIYFQGYWDVLYSERSVAVVGTRNPTDAGLARTRKLVKALVEDNVTVVSGLARGIDSEAHTTCIEMGGHTIGVLGTPLTRSYPKENTALQAQIATDHLIISQVPIQRYEMQVNPVQNRHFFPQRNIMMSALTDATIIVEAGPTSGTLVQAKAAISQGRKLFILDSCFQDDALTWPSKFEKLGAVRVKDYRDIQHALFSKALN